MHTTGTSPALRRLFSELVDGASNPRGGFILNTGDVGLLRSIDQMSSKARADLKKERSSSVAPRN